MEFSISLTSFKSNGTENYNAALFFIAFILLYHRFGPNITQSLPQIIYQFVNFLHKTQSDRPVLSVS